MSHKIKAHFWHSKNPDGQHDRAYGDISRGIVPVIVSIKMEVKTSGHDRLCSRSLRLERESASCNSQGRSCWSCGELLVTGIRFNEFPCMCGPGHREEGPGVTGGQGEGPLLAEEDLSIQWRLWKVLRIWREEKKVRFTVTKGVKGFLLFTGNLLGNVST